ncbi:MAG: hypothetical protein NC097_07525 [Clostridium sp.]|nr:hypothetical protein [Prevotella sp.]MCM1429627.1 hypothetical protein [Clostridium sp.]MCM1474689.1 hypothetical protein [Muribaculaceae bacterium]
MNKLLPYIGLATMLAMPMVSYAQEAEPDPEPVKLTIGYDVVKPESASFGNDIPTEFVLDFSVSSLKVTNIKDNSTFTKTVNGTDERDSEWTGTYAYLKMTFPEDSNEWLSAPLKSTVNADMTLTLSLDLSETPVFAAALKDPNIYTLTLVVPEDLYTVTATNINNKSLEYMSLGQEVPFTHLGSVRLATPTADPADGTRIERLQTIDLSFDIKADNDQEVQWQCLAELKPTVWVKYPGDTQWSQNGTAIASIELTDPTKATIKVRPATTAQGQYRIDIPMGTFSMYAQDPNGSASQEDPNATLYQYTNSAMSLRYAIGEDVSDGLAKETIISQCMPAEGSVNLEQFSAGMAYIQVVFNQIPTLDRTVNGNVQLFYNGGTTPLREVSVRNETLLRLQTQGISGYDNLLHVYFDANAGDIIEPGDYTVVFPAGLFLFGENQEPNSKFSLNYHIDKMIAYQVLPQADITVEALEEITILFNNCDKVEINENCDKKIIMATRNGAIEDAAKDVTINGKVVRIKFNKYTDSGYYFITIPDNYFNVTVDNEVIPNQVIERQWMIKALGAPQIEPAPGVLSGKSIYEVTLLLDDDQEITSVNDKFAYTRLLKVADNGEILFKPVISYFKPDLPENSIGSNYLTLIPSGEQPIGLTPGNYVFIPAATLYTITGGISSYEYFYFWTVLPDLPEFEKPVLTPNEFVTDTNLFTLTFGENVILKSKSNELSYLYPLNEDGTVGEYVATFRAMNGAKGNELDLVNTNGVTTLEPGVYSLQTPKGICWDNDNVAGAYNFNVYFGMSGVQILGRQGDLYDVYTIDGVKVLNKVEAGALNGLTPGLYIINGKKIMIK